MKSYFILFLLVFALLPNGIVSQHITQATQSQSLTEPIKSNASLSSIDQSYLTFDGYIAYVKNLIDHSEIIIEDADGSLVNQINLDIPFYADLELVNHTTILVSPFGSNLFMWNFKTNIIHEMPFNTHHDIVYRDDTNSFMGIILDRVRTEDDAYAYDSIIEFSANGSKLWEFNFSSIIDTELWNGDYLIGDYKDITHANSLDWDVARGKIWVNIRNTDQIFQIDYNRKSVDWILGNDGDFTLFDKNGFSVRSLFHQSHDIHMLSPTKLLLLDNQYQNPSLFSGLRSRLLIIDLDLDTYSAKISSEWIAPKSMYTSVWGSVEQLPNNNLLASFGRSDTPAIVEVNMTSQDYSVQLVSHDIFSIAAWYDAPFTQLTDNLMLLANIDNTVNLSLYSSYDWDIDEEYNVDLWLNTSKTYFDTIIPNDFWQSTNFSVNIPSFPPGLYNFTIQIQSEFGIRVIQQWIQIKDYYFTYPTDLLFEKGQDYILPFFGKFRYPVQIQIGNQSDLLIDQQWDGTNLQIHKDQVSVGNITLSYLLKNETMDIESGQFNFSLVTPFPPKLIKQSGLIFEWGDPITVNLTIFDLSDFFISLEVDGLSWYSQHLSSGTKQIQIDLSQLFEGSHYFTLILSDDLGQQTQIDLVIQIISPSSPKIRSNHPSTLDWGKTEELSWEIHGASSVRLYRGKTLLVSSDLEGYFFSHQIQWRADSWELEKYPIILELTNSDTTVNITENIVVNVLAPDYYASAIIKDRTAWVSQPENSLGAPDGQSAIVQFGYENGELTVDMNANIIDTDGNDLKVWATGGIYRLFVSSTPYGKYDEIGRGSGPLSFDIGQQNMSYVRIEYLTGDPVQVDAIEAVKIADPVSYSGNGEIKELELSSSEQVELIWNITDYLGKKYYIFVNNESILQEPWDGSTISYLFEPDQSISSYNITVLTENILGQTVQGTYLINIQRISWIIPVGIAVIVIFVSLKIKQNRF